MAQLRRYPNVLPPYLGSHNMNGNSERVERREKAKIARVQTSDSETNKEPSSSPLFPPPRKVSDSSDEITKTIKKSLGPYSNFVKIMHQEVSREKAPGQTCIGVDPVPATPTENKTQYFPCATNKTKAKDKLSYSTDSQERPKGNGGTEKLDVKHKSNLDTSRHKPLKLGEKLNDKKDSKDTKVIHKISLEKYKSNLVSASNGDKSNALSINKPKTGTSVKDDASTNHISQELNNDVEKDVKKEDTSEPPHQEPIEKVEKLTPTQKTKPVPLQLPSQNGNSSSLPQENLHTSPQHRDMKVQNILEKMTEPVNMPLTGIFTPLPKQNSRFPFPSNVNEKENSGVSDPTNSFMKDFDLSDDQDSDDERENNDDQSQRPVGQTRSRSSSSSSSSSSGDSSDSGAEEPDDKKITSTVRKTSMLNAVSPTTNTRKTPSPVQSVTTTPNIGTNDNSGKIVNRTLPLQTSPNLTSDESLGKSRTSSSKSDQTNLLENSEEDVSNKDSKDSLGKVEEHKCNEPKPGNKVKTSSPSAGQKHTQSLNRTEPETKESLPDTKIRIKVEKGSNDSFRVKTNKKKSESDCKQVGEVKNNIDKDKPIIKNGELTSKSSSKHEVKLQKTENGVATKIKKKGNKLEAQKKDKKSDDSIGHKKNKRKHKGSTGESGRHSKEKSDLCSSKEKSDNNMVKDKTEVHLVKEKTDEAFSKDTKRTKSSNKEKKKSDRTASLGFDSPSDGVEDENKVIDVVGDNSPVVKKRTMGNAENGVNGVHKNVHIDMPLGIQLVHDQDKDPTSLIVKIPLSFLKRIPGKFAENLSVESSRTDVELGSLEDGGKRPNDSWKKNGENGNMDVDHTEEIFSEKKRHLNEHGKRSPSWDGGQAKKRVRRDSQRDKSSTEEKKHKTPGELIAECEADIRKTEADAHLLQAKTLKRQADKLADKEAKSRTYVEAIVRFICCGKALEIKEDGEVRATQMYSDTTELLRFILKHVLGKTEDKRLLILCLRVQSLLLHKLYRLKGKQTIRNTQILAEHFKTSQKNNNMTSPYTACSKHVSTPSPLSPTPSPAGSVGSIGSSGSNSSGEGNHSQNGRHASTASVTSPVSVSIPQQIHGVMAQHVSSTSKLVNSIDMWDKADTFTADYQEFFTTVDSICGPLTFHSSIPHVVSYVKNSLSNFHEHGKET